MAARDLSVATGVNARSPLEEEIDRPHKEEMVYLTPRRDRVSPENNSLEVSRGVCCRIRDKRSCSQDLRASNIIRSGESCEVNFEGATGDVRQPFEKKNAHEVRVYCSS